MRPTFILTRAFAVTALVFGAAQVSFAAPIAHVSGSSAVLASGIDVAMQIQELPVVSRAEPVEIREVIETAESPPDDTDIQDVEERTCWSVAICR
ncbi:hypothetical protein EW026_g3736 [Hermanssonia centrifuga]|uniref:Uncharacterized protein n=1 Tax=Hermanssonia centrifuga TaxID=98765 RepID=A0A4S4KKG0_9APHY|nr:hypothetical protein EW026_g3736 [Hermanssonia centrifuga]